MEGNVHVCENREEGFHVLLRITNEKGVSHKSRELNYLGDLCKVLYIRTTYSMASIWTKTYHECYYVGQVGKGDDAFVSGVSDARQSHYK